MKTVCPLIKLMSSGIRQLTGNRCKCANLQMVAPERPAGTTPTAQRDARSPITPVWERMRRTFFGEMDNRAATREILRPSRFHTLGITMAANSSLICWNVLSPTIPCDH